MVVYLCLWPPDGSFTNWIDNHAESLTERGQHKLLHCCYYSVPGMLFYFIFFKFLNYELANTRVLQTHVARFVL